MPPKTLGAKAGAKARSKSGGPKAKAKQKPKASEHVTAIFRKFDADNSGTISRAELQSVLERLGLPAEATDHLMGLMDKNGDGVIDFEEFTDWVLAGSEEAKAALGLDEISLSVTNTSGDVVLEAVLPDYTCVVELKKRIQATTGTDLGLIQLLWKDAIAEDQTSLAALGVPADGAILQYVVLDQPTFEFPAELEVDGEIVPRRALLKQADWIKYACVEIAFYGSGKTPKLLMQFAASPDWRVRQVCGQVTGWGHERAQHFVEGHCCEGPPGTPLDNAPCSELFSAGHGVGAGFTKDYCGLLSAIGVKVGKREDFRLQRVDGDPDLIEIINDYNKDGRERR